MKKKTIFVVLLVILSVFLVSCTAGPNTFAGTENADGELAGFFMGLWHGCISFITFIISLFNDKVNVYEIHNKGPLYNLGFVLGAMIAYGGSGGSACRKRKNR